MRWIGFNMRGLFLCFGANGNIAIKICAKKKEIARGRIILQHGNATHTTFSKATPRKLKFSSQKSHRQICLFVFSIVCNNKIKEREKETD